MEVGHDDSRSLQSNYLDKARYYDKKESIFFSPPIVQSPASPPAPRTPTLEAMAMDAALPEAAPTKPEVFH